MHICFYTGNVITHSWISTAKLFPHMAVIAVEDLSRCINQGVQERYIAEANDANSENILM